MPNPRATKARRRAKVLEKFPAGKKSFVDKRRFLDCVIIAVRSLEKETYWPGTRTRHRVSASNVAEELRRSGCIHQIPSDQQLRKDLKALKLTGRTRRCQPPEGEVPGAAAEETPTLVL
jgi:hypothetical protein